MLSFEMVWFVLQEKEKAKEGEVRQLQQKKGNADKTTRKLVESQATDKKKQEHAEVCTYAVDLCAGTMTIVLVVLR